MRLQKNEADFESKADFPLSLKLNRFGLRSSAIPSGGFPYGGEGANPEKFSELATSGGNWRGGMGEVPTLAEVFR